MPDGGTTLFSTFTPLAAELGDLKRVRDARSAVSVASRLFRVAWSMLLDGGEASHVARVVSAEAVASARLGALDATVLTGHGADAATVRQASFDAVARALPRMALAPLRDALDSPLPLDAGLRAGTDFVEALIAQPRAGATCPGKPRLVLEPPEGHGDHCLLVAVLGTGLAYHYGADPATVFLIGLAHHFHNASLPDSGFTGEMMLGDALVSVVARATELVTSRLPATLQAQVRAAMRFAADAETPEGRAFHAADVLDRVLQMAQYARVAAFTLDRALGGLQLVHDGPAKPFHDRVLAEAGLA